ncbi:MAG: BamA/TamA family outer membrane protein [Acidobacteriota bacterium]
MAATLLIAALAAAPLDWNRVPIERVRFDVVGKYNKAELTRVFGVKAGEPLSRVELRAGVQALIASRLVEDADVSVAMGPQGADVTVKMQLASAVSDLKVEGLPPAYRRHLIAALGLSRGSPLLVHAFVAGLDREVQRLRSEGYPDARLEPDLRFDLAQAKVAVTIVGTLGVPILLSDLEAPGSGLAGSKLLAAAGVHPAARVSRDLLSTARGRLAASLHRAGYWQALVEAPEVRRDDHRAVVEMRVERGPKYALKLSGVKQSRALDAAALPFLKGEESFDETGLDLIEQRLRIFLQDQGRMLAKAKASLSKTAEGRTLEVTVDPGPITPIAEVIFPGLTALPPSAMRSRIGARTGHPWRWGGEPVDEASLAADASSILGTLQEAGYADAQVATARIVAQGDRVAIEFPVTEGTRRLVSSLDVNGLPGEVKMAALPLSVDGPWSSAAELHAINMVRTALQDAGYPDAKVTGAESCKDDRCAVRIDARPGEYAVLGRVAIAGLARSSPTMVRKVARLKEGQPAGPNVRLEAQRRLLGLGIFQSVTVAPIPGQESGPESGLVLDVAEAQTQAVSFGLGWDTEYGVRGSASWSELNLFGTGRSLGVDLRASRNDSRWQVTFREPAELGFLGVPTWFSIYRSEEIYTGYPLRRRGMWVEIGDRVHRPGRFLLRYDYQIVDNTAPPEILSPSERDKANIKIASLTPTLEWDTRDDLFAPKRGLFASMQLQVAFKAFNADARFEKLSTSVTGYTPFLGGVLAASVRGGAIQASGVPPGTPDNLAVPVAVRFFAGGRISQRAFPLDKLGILGQTLLCPEGVTTCAERSYQAVGGAGLLLSNVEWRFPVAGPVGGVLFVDGGNDWASWHDITPAGMRWGTGLGLRVESPVGPFRVEYGWKLDRKPGESGGQLFVSFGNPF